MDGLRRMVELSSGTLKRGGEAGLDLVGDGLTAWTVVMMPLTSTVVGRREPGTTAESVSMVGVEMKQCDGGVC